MPNRISKTWVHTDFLAICHIADEDHKAAARGGPINRGAGDSCVGALVALLDRYASRCDCADLARKFGCAPDPKSLAYAIRDDADERGISPSTALVDHLNLIVL